MTMKTFLAPALLLSLSLIGCATDDSSSADIEATPLAGSIGGQAWTFQAGNTDSFLSEGEDTFFATMFPTTFTTCGFSEPGGNHIIVSLPKVPGDYPMSLSRNMTFVVGNDNKIAVDGMIRIDEVTATHITGGIVSSFDSQNTVNGTFDIPICPAD
jgi:hypothetical protein